MDNTTQPISVVIDGNFLWHTEYSIYTNYGKSDGKFNNDRDQVAFVVGAANKLLHSVNSLPRTGKVIFCMDSKSWRKTVEIEGGEYKGSRERKDGSKGTMDRETKEVFYKLMDEFANLLNDKGIITTRILGAEGDDLLYLWSKRLNAIGHNCIIITGDRDMSQCVSGNAAPWTVVWNGSTAKGRMYTAPGWREKWLHDMNNDVFDFSMSGAKDGMLRLIRDSSIELEYINTDAFAFTKVIVGDSGDDVPSVWTREKNERTYKVTEKKVTEIMESLGPLDNWMAAIDDSQFVDNLSGMILRIMKDVDGTDERKPIVDRIYRNRRLMWLDHSVIPEKLINDVDLHITESLAKPNPGTLNRKFLLGGTRFEAPNIAPSAFDPYKFMDLPEL